MSDTEGLIVRIKGLPIVRRVLRRPAGSGPSTDPAHAEGHRHVEPPPDQSEPGRLETEPRRNQPWIRRSHSDSQRRRFRR